MESKIHANRIRRQAGSGILRQGLRDLRRPEWFPTRTVLNRGVRRFDQDCLVHWKGLGRRNVAYVVEPELAILARRDIYAEDVQFVVHAGLAAVARPRKSFQRRTVFWDGYIVDRARPREVGYIAFLGWIEFGRNAKYFNISACTARVLVF